MADPHPIPPVALPLSNLTLERLINYKGSDFRPCTRRCVNIELNVCYVHHQAFVLFREKFDFNPECLPSK